MNQNNLLEINKKIQEIFNRAGFLVGVKNAFIEGKTIFVSLKSEEPRVLIGRNGRTLSEIQHLIGAVLKKGSLVPEDFFIDLDIGNYKEKKMEYLRELAQDAADWVSLSKKEKTLDPMPTYERRIIHLELTNRQDIFTESVGEGKDRRVVIKPKTN
ncbi:MAG TPA: hypothetical protein ENL27_01840 [Candidatus Parcubacteria bacterium]|nr:hypothetical protein [Candidatus Parcubacteria bacterium]